VSQSEIVRRNELIEARLAAGDTCSEIARDLRLSLSVVSTVALKAGYRSRPGPPLRFDWPAIREFYEAGHTKRECRERFGFSNGAWRQAVARGDVVPRSLPDPIKYSHRTRRQVEEGLASGKSQAQIARELELSKGTIAFHVRSLGFTADARFSRRYDWRQIQAAYDGGMTAAQCCETFGCSKASWSQAVGRGDIRPRPRRTPLAELLALGPRRNRFHLKARLIEAGLKNNRCESCGLTEWHGAPITLELHHVNGDPLDNRLEVLQLLCPNCHSQTENYGRRNLRPPA
jgi:DNA-binding CsgD family transcriptional regulator